MKNQNQKLKEQDQFEETNGGGYSPSGNSPKPKKDYTFEIVFIAFCGVVAAILIFG